MIKSLHYRSGSALITVLITTTVFLSLIGIIYSLTSLTQVQNSRETKIRQAIDLGNSGINRGLAKYRSLPSYQGEPYRFSKGGEVDIQVDPNTSDNPYTTITAQAYVPDKNSPDRICRAFRVNVDPEALDSDGNNLPSIVTDSYHEIKCQLIPPPPVNEAPQLTIVKPGAGGDIAQVRQNDYTVIYTLYDTDNAVNTSLYYDDNNSGANGQLMRGSCALTDAGTSATEQKSCNWDISGIAPGSYYVYGIVDDGKNPAVIAYSAGPVTIPDAPPTLAINQPDGVGDSVAQGAIYQVNYDLLDINSVVNAKFYYDTNNTGFDGVALAGQCASAAEGLGVTCDWVIPKTLAAGNYYIYGTVTDSVNPIVRAYSSGPVTVTPLPPPPTNLFTITKPPVGNMVVWRDPDVTVTNEFTVAYNLDDSTGVRLANFYFDTDNNAANGHSVAGTVCTNQGEGSNMSCSTSLAEFPDGTYYVYGEVIGKPTLNAFSPGTVTIKTKVNVPPSLSIAKPSTAETLTAGVYYNIKYSLSDTDSVVTAAFFYDNDKVGFNGTALTGPCAKAPEGSDLLCAWNTTGMTPGTYHIYGVANDGTSETQVYAVGSIIIQAPNTAPTLSFSQPDGVNDSYTVGNNVPIQYSLADPDNVVTASLYFDTDNNKANGFGTSIATCSAVAEGNNVTCNWSTTGVSAGSYYIYGLADDGVNQLVDAYSPGKVTLTGVPVDVMPTVSIQNPDGVSDTYTTGYTGGAPIIYSLNDPDSVVNAKFFYSTNPKATSGTLLSCIGTGEDGGEGTNRVCTWNINGMVPGNYYIIAQVDTTVISQATSDPENNTVKVAAATAVSVKTLSPGPFTIGDACSGRASSSCPPPPECSDHADNDGDGKIDYPNDPGCDDPNDIEPDDIASQDVVKAVVTDSAGNVYVGGYRKRLESSNNDAVIRKYLPSGAPDTSWATNGMAIYKNTRGDAIINDLGLDSNNNLYAVGMRTGEDSEKWMIRKYTPTGALATGFGSSGTISYSRGGASEALKILVRNNDLYVLGTTKYKPAPYEPWSWRTDPKTVSIPHVRRYTTNGVLCDGKGNCPSWGDAGSYRVMGLYECENWSTTPTIVCPVPNAVQTVPTDLYYDADGDEQGLYVSGYVTTNSGSGQSQPIAWVMKATPGGARDFDFIGEAPTRGGVFYKGRKQGAPANETYIGARGYNLLKLDGDIKLTGTQTKKIVNGATTTRAQEGFTLNFRSHGTNTSNVIGQASQQVDSALSPANIFHTLGWGQNDTLLIQQYNGSATWGWDSTQPAAAGTGKLIDADVVQPTSFSFDASSNLYAIWTKDNGCSGCRQNLDWMLKKYDSTGHIVTSFGTNGVVTYDSRFDTN